MILAQRHFSVLGADGHVGRSLARHLAAEGARVDRYGRDRSDYLARPLGHAVYCIGLTADFLVRPFDTVEAHVSLFSRLLEKADFESMTYLSSTRLYDSGDGTGLETAPLVLDPRSPRHLYDFSKGLGEVLCRTSGRENVRAARLSCVYDADLEADNFLHATLRTAVTSRRATVAANPGSARDYVHMDDVCRALAAIAVAGRRQIYNVASGENIDNRSLFEMIRALTGCELTAGDSDLPAPPAPRVDIAALQDDFGLRPMRLGEALPSIIARLRGATRHERIAS